MEGLVNLAAGELCWLSGFGGIKRGTIDGVTGWPARILEDQAEGSARVQEKKKHGTVLVKSFGDDAYVWAKPTALRPFVKAEEVARKAPARMQPALQAALAEMRRLAAISVAEVTAAQTMLPKAATSVREAPPPVAQTESGLSAYELQRLETMRENQRVLEALGVATASDCLRVATATATTPQKAAVDPEVRAARAAERHARLLEAQVHRRTSSRLQALPLDGSRPKRFAEEYAELDEVAREDAVLRKRARASAAGGGGGRGGRKAAVLDALGPEERAAVAAAYEEASGWLDAMAAYFADKLSEANLRNVMKQATALATGEGVPHTQRSTWFRRGQPVTLDEDLIALRAAANRFLRPEEDPGHGWRLDHPIGKMCLFQAHLHHSRHA